MITVTNLQHLYSDRKNYQERHEILIPFVLTWLQENGKGRTYVTAQITDVVMEHFNLVGKVNRSWVASDIGGMTRDKRTKLHTRTGPERVVFGQRCRPRVWVAPASPHATDDEILETAEEAKAKGRQRHLDEKGVTNVDTLAGAIAFLEDQGYTILKPGEDVKPVDKPVISRHSGPGLSKVTCGECGGSGHVFMRKTQ